MRTPHYREVFGALLSDAGGLLYLKIPYRGPKFEKNFWRFLIYENRI